MFKEPSPLLKVKCKECGNEMIVFSKPSNDIKCLNCEKPIIKSTGGKGEIIGCEIIEVIK